MFVGEKDLLISKTYCEAVTQPCFSPTKRRLEFCIYVAQHDYVTLKKKVNAFNFFALEFVKT